MICGDCKLDLKEEDFYKDSRAKTGYRWNCKSCCRERNKNSAAFAKYRASEKGKQKIFAWNNSDHGKRIKKEWAHSEKGRPVVQKSRERLKDWQREYHRQWRETPAGRESINRRSRERRALKAAVTVESFTEEDVLSTYGEKCHICKEPIELSLPRTHSQGLHLDHVIPLARGGEHSLANVKPAHAKCNLKKGSRV